MTPSFDQPRLRRKLKERVLRRFERKRYKLTTCEKNVWESRFSVCNYKHGVLRLLDGISESESSHFGTGSQKQDLYLASSDLFGQQLDLFSWLNDECDLMEGTLLTLLAETVMRKSIVMLIIVMMVTFIVMMVLMTIAISIMMTIMTNVIRLRRLVSCSGYRAAHQKRPSCASSSAISINNNSNNNININNNKNINIIIDIKL